MNENGGYWGGGISIISQNFPKSPSIYLIPPFPKQALKQCYVQNRNFAKEILLVLMHEFILEIILVHHVHACQDEIAIVFS
jgi:hypothetical protein